MTQAGSQLVSLSVRPPLAVVTMQDFDRCNQLTGELSAALVANLREAGGNDQVRVVILAGLPDYFCTGAPKELVLTDVSAMVSDFWQAALSIAECPVPVVAAAQGSALDGGLLLALYCDVKVFSQRSRYAAPFLRHGLTPGAGATYLLPAVMGPALGTEMLYAGRSYLGRELADRGAGLMVEPHDAVPGEAHRTASYIAQAPRRALALLKANLTTQVRLAAEAALAAEQDRARNARQGVKNDAESR